MGINRMQQLLELEDTDLSSTGQRWEEGMNGQRSRNTLFTAPVVSVRTSSDR